MRTSACVPVMKTRPDDWVYRLSSGGGADAPTASPGVAAERGFASSGAINCHSVPGRPSGPSPILCGNQPCRARGQRAVCGSQLVAPFASALADWIDWKSLVPAWIFGKLGRPVSIRRKPANRTCAGPLARLMSGPAFQAGVRGSSRARRINAMAGVAQLVRAPVCGTGGRRFETGHSPHFSRHGASSVASCRAGSTLRAWRNW